MMACSKYGRCLHWPVNFSLFQYLKLKSLPTFGCLASATVIISWRIWWLSLIGPTHTFHSGQMFQLCFSKTLEREALIGCWRQGFSWDSSMCLNCPGECMTVQLVSVGLLENANNTTQWSSSGCVTSAVLVSILINQYIIRRLYPYLRPRTFDSTLIQFKDMFSYVYFCEREPH